MSEWLKETMLKYNAFIETEKFQSEDGKAFSQESYQRFIDLDPIDAKRFAFRPTISCFEKEKAHVAIADYSKAIKLDPGIADWYGRRALRYWQLSKHEEALQDFSKAIEIDPKNPKWYEYRAETYFKLNNYESAIHDYDKVIGILPNKSIFYVKRSGAYLKMGCYGQGIHDCNKAIELEAGKADAYFLRSLLLRETNDGKENVESDLSKAVELSESLLLFYYLIIDHYDKKKYKKVVEIGNDFDWTHFKYRGSLEIDVDKYLEDYRDDEHSRIKAAIGTSYYYLHDYEASVKWLEEAFEYPVVNVHYEFIEPSDAWREFSKQKETNAKIEERNKVIENLSHSIKNLISTVIVPLENLKQKETVQPHIIQNALRGANLIREIVNAVNLSYKGSQEDLLYDVRHNSGNDAMSLASMFLESLKHSVSNMFDGKYFHNFMRKYFSEKEFFLSAKQDWANLSQSDTISALKPFLTKHFFHLDIDIADADQFIIGNEQGSAIKLLIMIQELILNAVKYAAFVKKEDRLLKILFAADANTINIRVENTFVEKVKTKTTGTGHVIISNFAKLLGTEPVVKKENGIYSLQITFQNFWKVAKK